MDYTRNEDKLCNQGLSTLQQSRLIDLDIEEADGITEPVTVTEVKNHLRITFTDDDSYLEMLIISARKALETYTALSFVAKTIRFIAEQVLPMELPYGPVKEIISVKNKEEDLITGYKTKDIKFLSVDLSGYIDVSYTAGYEEDKLPADLKLALLEEISWRYENRGDNNGKSGISNIAKSYAKPHRRVPKVL